MAESIPLENLETRKKSKYFGLIKMKALNGHKALQVNNMVKQNIDEKSIVFNEKSTSYLDISNYVETHVSYKSNQSITSNQL